MAHSMHDASLMNQRLLQDEGRTVLLSHAYNSVGLQHTLNDSTGAQSVCTYTDFSGAQIIVEFKHKT